MAAESVHKGHRERLKHRFLEEGLDNFTDVQVLELLLKDLSMSSNLLLLY